MYILLEVYVYMYFSIYHSNASMAVPFTMSAISAPTSICDVLLIMPSVGYMAALCSGANRVTALDPTTCYIVYHVITLKW